MREVINIEGKMKAPFKNYIHKLKHIGARLRLEI